jgi:peptidyl-tRNA hydrolase, PTH1 family
LKLVVGLGNPGVKYSKNRHNVGFMLIDTVTKEEGLGLRRSLRLEANIAKFETAGVVFAKPRTFMNNSGRAVSKLVSKYGIDLADLLIIYDDVNLELGRIKLALKGSSGGHNGMGSIIQSLGTRDIPRLRIGVSPPPPDQLVKYVLSNFRRDENIILKDVLNRSSQACLDWIRKGSEYVMQVYNVRKKER